MGVLVEVPDDLDTLRAVVDLVEPAPEEVRLVAEAVPPVVDEGERQVADDGPAGDAKAIRRPRPVPQHPAVPGHGGDEYHAHLETVEQGGAEPPPGHPRPRAARPEQFAADHEQPNAEDDQGDDHGSLPLRSAARELDGPEFQAPAETSASRRPRPELPRRAALPFCSACPIMAPRCDEPDHAARREATR